MARRKTTADWLMDLHRAGRTDREIAAATGRGESFIQKVRTGKKPGLSLLPAARRLASAQRQRTTGTAKPLPNVSPAAPRRVQRLRTPQKHEDRTGANRFYSGKTAGRQLLDRLVQAGKRGRLVRLTITWAFVRYGTGHRTNKAYPDVPLTLWEEGVDAWQARGELDSAGYGADAERGLANLTYDQFPIVQDVSGVVAWQLHTFDPASDEWEDD